MEMWEEVSEIQPLASKIITNSILKDRMSHAYLLQGEKGTGKKDIALLMAKVLYCERDALEPCQECSSCRRIASGNHPDVHWIAPQEQSIKKEQIVYLQKEFMYSGLESNQKVYIIEEADTLTTNAANRLLKFLEEPDQHATAILLTSNSRSILPTIRSRCQVIDLKPLDSEAMKIRLQEHGLTLQDASILSAITNNVDEALTLNEDAWFAESRKLMIQLIEIFIKDSASAYLFIHSDWMPHFKDRAKQLLGIDLLLLSFRDFLYDHIGNQQNMVVFGRDDTKLEKGSQFFSEKDILSILQAGLEAKQKLRQYVHPTLVMEQLTLQIKR